MTQKILQSKPLTTFELVTLLLSITGLVSLGLIAQQVRTAKIQTQALTTQSVNNQLLELDNLFIKNPELRPYFYYGTPIAKEDKSYDKALAVAEFELDFFESYLTQKEYLTLKDEDQQNWSNYIAESFSKSPIMCVRLKDARGWYSDELYHIANCR